MIYKYLLPILAPIFLTGCDNNNSTPESEKTGVTIEAYQNSAQREPATTVATQLPAPLLQQHHTYAITRYLSDSSLEFNSVVIPFDEQQMLAMIALGADGTSLEELSTTVMIDFSEPENHMAMGNWIQTIEISNAFDRQLNLWGQTGYRFSEVYLQSQTDFYGPQISGLDFIDISSEANARIYESFPQVDYVGTIDNRIRLVIGQQSLLNSGWSPNDLSVESFVGRFINHDTDQQRWLAMVRLTGMMNSTATAEYRALEIPLDDPEVALLVVEPGSNSLTQLRNNSSDTFFQDILQQLTPAQISISLPEFTVVRNNTDIKHPAPSSIFNEEDANFFNINNAGYLYLESWVQAVTFKLNTQGMTGKTTILTAHRATDDEPVFLLPNPIGLIPDEGNGSVSGVTLTDGSGTLPQQPCFYPPDQLPFQYFVYHRNSGAILYAGHVTTLSGYVVEPDWYVPAFDQCGDAPPP